MELPESAGLYGCRPAPVHIPIHNLWIEWPAPGGDDRSPQYPRFGGRRSALCQLLDAPTGKARDLREQRLDLPLGHLIGQDQLLRFGSCRDVGDPVIEIGCAAPHDGQPAQPQRPAPFDLRERLSTRLHDRGPSLVTRRGCVKTMTKKFL